MRTGMMIAAMAATVSMSVATSIEPARANQPEAIGAGEQMFAFSVCNRTRNEVSVAISARLAPGSSDFVVSGWWKVAGGGCRTIGTYPRGNFYMHATSGGTTWGKGDTTLCVETPGPFKRINISGYKCSGSLLRKFSRGDVQSAKWEWTLNP